MTQNTADQLGWLLDHSLARGTGQQVGCGEVRQTIIEMESAFLFVMAAGRGTCLAVLASIGTHLTAAPRSPEHPAAR